MTYEDLVNECDIKGIIVIDKHFKSNAHGLIKGNKIAIRKDIPTLKEKSCVLAEELGHYYTTVGNILDTQTTVNNKQELKARMWGYNQKIGLLGIINAFEAHCTNLYEVTEYLDVTELYLLNAIDSYKKKYGIYKKIDNYIIYFEPCLAVMKLF